MSPYGLDHADEDRPKRSQLSDEAADHIRELIVSGQLRGGDHIRQDHMADELGISATPVREALLSLRGQGFVTLYPRRGYVVAPLSGKDLRDVFVGQALLAAELAARASERISAENLARLRELQTQLISAGAESDADAVERLNHSFHKLVNLSGESPKILWLLSITARFAPRRFFSSIPGWIEASIADHAAIIEGLESSDASATRTAMYRHIETAGVLLAENFEASNPPGSKG